MFAFFFIACGVVDMSGFTKNINSTVVREAFVELESVSSEKEKISIQKNLSDLLSCSLSSKVGKRVTDFSVPTFTFEHEGTVHKDVLEDLFEKELCGVERVVGIQQYNERSCGVAIYQSMLATLTGAVHSLSRSQDDTGYFELKYRSQGLIGGVPRLGKVAGALNQRLNTEQSVQNTHNSFYFDQKYNTSVLDIDNLLERGVPVVVAYIATSAAGKNLPHYSMITHYNDGYYVLYNPYDNKYQCYDKKDFMDRLHLDERYITSPLLKAITMLPYPLGRQPGRAIIDMKL